MEWIELGELGKVSTGNTPSKKKIEYYNEKYIELVKPSNFTENMIVSIESGEEYLSKEGKSKGRVAEIGDILVTCIGNIGNVGIASKEVCFNQQVNSIKVDKKKVLSKYVAYSILYIKPALNHVANKAVVPIINKSTFEKIKIPVPPMEIQKKIVEVLDEAQKLIDNRKKQIKLLDDLIESIFYDMFGDPVKNDKGWEVKKLGDNLDFIKYGVSSPPEFSVNGKCFIRATNIDNGRISSTDMKYIGLDEQSRLDNYKLDLGDVLMVRSGVNAGDSAYIDSNYAGGYGGYDLIIRLNKTKLNYIFLNQIFQSNFKEKIIKPLTRRAAQPHINATQVKKLDIIISPLSLQNEFAKKVQAIEKQKELLEKSLKLMEDNYSSLMQRAFKGELF